MSDGSVSFFLTVHYPFTLAYPHDHGYYLPKQENEFIHNIFEELEIFLQRNEQKSVLLFPPLPSRLRYLIQKTIESYPSLSTFCVGEAWSRRAVVCHSHLRLPSEVDRDTNFYEQPLGLAEGKEYGKNSYKPLLTTRWMRGRSNSWPEKAIYTPRANQERKSPTQAAGSLSVSEESSSDTTEGPLSVNQDEMTGSTEQLTNEQDSFVSCKTYNLQPWPPAWDQTVSYFTAMSLDFVAEEPLDVPVLPASEQQRERTQNLGDFSSEIAAKLKEDDVIIMSTQKDYSCYEDVWIDPKTFSHILEIYKFPAMFKTADLLDAFADLSEKGLEIHWVDSTHALAVFSCKSAALQALSFKHPLIRVRKLSNGTRKSKGKALRLAELHGVKGDTR